MHVAAWDAGIRSFGESRLQEAEGKISLFLAARPAAGQGKPKGARFDMVGHIQSNKAKKVVALFTRLQSIDSVDADTRARQARPGRRPRLEVLLELHTGEESKEGFRGPDELFRALEMLLALEGRRLEPRGLMTMAPAADEVAIRRSFRAVHAALEGARTRFGSLSAQASTSSRWGCRGSRNRRGRRVRLVRIGTALFGERTP